MNRPGEDPSATDGGPEDSRAADRLIAFSDAVVAIAMTLLALELPVPEGNTASRFWSSVRDNESHYLAFLISFVAIAAAWSQHHHVFNYLKRVDPRLRNLNMGWLMMMVLNPFATKLLTTAGHADRTTHALIYGFYALLQTLSTVAMLAMVRRMETQSLQTSDAPSTLVKEADQQSLTIILGFGLSIPIFFATPYAWILWFAAPLLLRATAQLRSRQGNGAEPA